MSLSSTGDVTLPEGSLHRCPLPRTDVPPTIYGMEKIVKTTVYLPDAEYRRLKALARSEGRSTAELLREAVKDYARRRGSPGRPRSVGMLAGGDSLAERSEELLEGFGAET